jgi:putative ABC transport system permease protein
MQGPWNINSTVSAVEWDGKDPQETLNMHWDYVDYDYFQTLGINVIQGRPFSKDYSSDGTQAYLVNEEAAKLMGMDSPVGQRLSVFRKEGTIIGVVKNFHFQPMYFEIKPFVFMLRPASDSYVFLKLKPDHTPSTLEFIKKAYTEFEKDMPFSPLFFNDILKTWIYSSEIQASKIAGYFTLLAIVISSLGLFGLAAFMAERRTKEIGIRKVLGASVSSVVVMLSKDFTKWVVLSNIFAWPAAYFFLRKLLERYAYRVNLGLEIFIFSAAAALFIAISAVGYQAFKAAQANPVKSLRYE